MPNFVQGALQNALSIQSNPDQAMSNARQAFADSGTLALKLTSLLDAEEKQREDNMRAIELNAIKDRAQIETGRSNLVTEAETSRRNLADEGLRGERIGVRKDELQLRQDRYDLDKGMLEGQLDAPLLDTTSSGTEMSTENIGVFGNQIQERQDELDQRKQLSLETQKKDKEAGLLEGGDRYSDRKIRLHLKNAKDIVQEQKWIDEDVNTLGNIQNNVITKNIPLPQLKQNVQQGMMDIDNDSTLSTAQKFGRKKSLKTQYETEAASRIKDREAITDLKLDIAKENRLQKGKIELETLKSTNKEESKKREILQKARSSNMSKAKLAVLKQKLEDRSGGWYDWLVHSPSETLKEFEDNYQD